MGRRWLWETLTVALALAARPAGAAEYALATAGRPAASIVLPANTGPVLRHAAEELARYLAKVSGATLAIAPEPIEGLYPVRLTVVAASATGLPPEVAQLRDDGFVIAADRSGLRVLSREPVGVLFGVYHLLKRYAGLRWFHPGPDGESCPQQPTVTVPEQVTVSNPSFRYREISFVCANVNSRTVATWDWMLRNGLPIHTMKHVYPQIRAETEPRGVRLDEGGHCFAYLLSDQLFDEHPEYFGLFDGRRKRQDYRYQPCTTNPRVAEIMAAGIAQKLDAQPVGGRYLIGNNDATDWCQCDACTRLDPPDEKAAGRISTRYATFVNTVAQRVWATHPNANLWAWAYQNYQLPPTGVALDPRLALEACVHHRCYRHALDDPHCPANAKFRDMLKGWVQGGRPVTVREYNEVFPGDPPYLPFERVYCRDLKYYHRLGLAGFRLPIAPPDGTFGPTWDNRATRESWLAQWPAVYLAAMLGWDITTDVAQATEDLGSRYYGPAWPAMKPYRELLARIFEETPGDIVYGAGGLGTCLEWPGAQARLEALLRRADQLAAADALIRRRVQRDRDHLTWSWIGAHQQYLATRPRETHAARRSGPITIDGRLDEPDWRQAAYTTNFVTVQGRPADPQTFVRVLYDTDHLYFAVEAMEPSPDRLKALATERDGPRIWGDSTVEFFLVAPGMAGRYAQIAVNPRGTVYDALNASATAADLTFDSRAAIKTAILPDRWVVEARVPTGPLGRALREGETWKVNVGRNRQLVDGPPSQASSWSNGAFHGLDAYRPLVFGGTPLLRNGDFEETVKASEKVKAPGWTFPDDLAPTHWSFTQGGTATVVSGDAASGQRFYRGRGWLFQFIRLAAEYRGQVRVRLQARGRGRLWVATFQYQRQPYQFLTTVVAKDQTIESAAWTPIEATQPVTDDRLLALALHLDGTVDVDDVLVTAE